MARALGGGEGLGQVAALAQSDAVLEAGAALRRALGREGKSAGVREGVGDGGGHRDVVSPLTNRG